MGLLDTLKSNTTEAPLGVDDVTANEFHLSPQEAEVFDRYQQERQMESGIGTGALHENAYYPGANNNVAVGGYSGSLIGSTTLFAPGGGLVPLGMMDARDQAVKVAALKKAKEVDDFRKQFKAPTSKLTNLNEGLTKEYFAHAQGGWNKAMKKANGDPVLAKKFIENDPEFWAKEKSFRDFAENGNHTATKIAQDDLDERSGKFIPTPEYKELRRRVLQEMNPSDPGFKNFMNTFRAMEMERNFSDAVEEVTKKAFADEIGKSGIDLDDPEFMEEWQKSTREWSQDQKDDFAKTLAETHFAGSSYYTPERIKRNVDRMLSGKKTTSKRDVTQKHDDSSDSDIDIDSISKEEVELVGGRAKVDGTGRPVENPIKTAYSGYDGVTFKKPVGVIIPVGTQAFDPQTATFDNNIGNVEGELGGIVNIPVFQNKGGKFDNVPVDKKTMNSPGVKERVKYVPMVTFRYKKKNEDGQDEIVSTYVPLASVRNSVSGKNGRNKKALEEIERLAEERTKQLHGTKKEESAAAEKTTPAPKVDPKKAKNFQNKYGY